MAASGQCRIDFRSIYWCTWHRRRNASCPALLPDIKPPDGLSHFTFYAGDTRLWARTEELGHTLTLGGGTATTFTYEPLFTVADAYGLDVKLDDGKPGLGMVQIMYWPECSTAAAADQYETAEYQLNNENESQCGLVFPNAINP